MLEFRASEVAGILGTTEESVTSALKRARGTLAKQGPGAAAAPPAAGSAAELRLVRRLTAAFAAADVAAVVTLLTDDAWFTMPPLPLEYQGRDLAGEFLAATAFRPGWVPALVGAGTRVNGGQPAFGFYMHNVVRVQMITFRTLPEWIMKALPVGDRLDPRVKGRSAVRDFHAEGKS